MNQPRILGIGTASPPVRLTQEQSFHAAGYQGERIRKIFLNSDIDYRHFYLESGMMVTSVDDSGDSFAGRSNCLCRIQCLPLVTFC